MGLWDQILLPKFHSNHVLVPSCRHVCDSVTMITFLAKTACLVLAIARNLHFGFIIKQSPCHPLTQNNDHIFFNFPAATHKLHGR